MCHTPPFKIQYLLSRDFLYCQHNLEIVYLCRGALVLLAALLPAQEQGYGAVDQQQGQNGVDQPAVPGEEALEDRPEGRPAQGKDKADEGQQQGKGQQGEGLPAVVGEDVGFHRQDAVEVDFGIDKLEQGPGQEAAPGVVLLHLPGAVQGLPGQVEHV